MIGQNFMGVLHFQTAELLAKAVRKYNHHYKCCSGRTYQEFSPEVLFDYE